MLDAEERIKEFEQHITHGGWCDMYEPWHEHNVPVVRRTQADALRWALQVFRTIDHEENAYKIIADKATALEWYPMEELKPEDFLPDDSK